jgi:hypothetical protein
MTRALLIAAGFLAGGVAVSAALLWLGLRRGPEVLATLALVGAGALILSAQGTDGWAGLGLVIAAVFMAAPVAVGAGGVAIWRCLHHRRDGR